MTRIETVSIIYQHPKILLGMKKARFGKGRYNGFGGGVRPGENLIKSAIRETEEESGIIIQNPLLMGNLYFRFQSKEEQDHDVYFFKVSCYTGELKESEEMKFEWFHIDQIPYEQMWPIDKYWLPLLLKGVLFMGKVKYNLEGKIATHKIKEVKRLNKK